MSRAPRASARVQIIFRTRLPSDSDCFCDWRQCNHRAAWIYEDGDFPFLACRLHDTPIRHQCRDALVLTIADIEEYGRVPKAPPN